MDTSRPRYLHMFLVFVKIGLFTIGGGPAMIPLIRDEFVEKQKWIGDEDITDVLALSQSLPGVIAVNASTFLGYRLGGLKGSLVATIGVVLPSFVIIFVIVTAFTSSGFDQYPNILKFFDGINSAITALLIHQLKASGATDIAVSPNGKEVAFIVRGDVYVTSVDYETTKQITHRSRISL